MRCCVFIFLSLSLISCGGYEAVSELNNFQINFPYNFEHDTIVQENYTVEVFYAYSKDSLIQYQVAANTIEGENEIIPDTLFKYSIMGPATKLQAMSMDKERLKLGDNIGMRFTLLGIHAASVYDMYLVDRKLYHICIINKQPRKPTFKEIERFMGSFKLLK